MSKATKKFINKREKLFLAHRITVMTNRLANLDNYKVVWNEVNKAVSFEKCERPNKSCNILRQQKSLL